MPSRLSVVLRCTGALVLLAACTWLFELAAFLLLWRHQTLAPYAFFPNQSWDFLAKIRWFADPLLSWAPGLPDRFAGLEASDKLGALAPLLPATLVTAIVVGIVAGAACSLVRRRRTTLRRDVVEWALVAIVVHVSVSLPAFGLDEGLRISRLAYRARSLVVDGMLLASAVSVAGAALAFALAPVIERSRLAATAGLVVLLVVTGGAASTRAPAPLAAPSAATPPAGERPHRSVVLISLDSLRADHVGAYGYGRDTSPNFDRFAKGATLFRHMTSTSSWTLPTHLTMFTGKSQLAHGVVVDTLVLSKAIPTLGEIFHEAGYSTAGFVSGPYVNGHYGYDRGMDTYLDLSAGEKGAEARGAVLSPVVNEKALAWLDQQQKGQPFFLFLHYFDIHYDYVPPAPYDTMFDPDYTGTVDGRNFIERDDVNAKMPLRDLEHIEALYDGEIRFTDEHVGRVLDRLKAKGLFDDAVVMIVADHGDEFFEHGNKGHHRTVYDEVLHVPTALKLPDGEGAGRVVDTQASLLDVFPTLLDAAGLATPAGSEGESLAGWIRGDASSRSAVYSDFYDKRGFNLQVSRRTDTGKTIQHFNRISHPKKGALESYDLASDAAEKQNLASKKPDEVADAVEAMTRWLEERWRFHRSVAAAGGNASIEIDEETRQRLKSLGYVGN